MRILVDGWAPGSLAFGDDEDATFTTMFDAPVDGRIRFDGIATLATVRIDGEPVASSSSMWVPVEVPITAGEHRIDVECRALAPELAIARKPRAHWRQKITPEQNLRWFRTTLNGRAPGFAPGPPVVGLWRPAWFIAGEPSLNVRARLEGENGIVTVESDAPDGTVVRVSGQEAALANGRAELRIASPERWWPHSHGEPRLYEVILDGHEVARNVGFRTVAAPGDILRDGLKVVINDVPAFIRGAVWTPVPDTELRATLETARDHGLNAIRIPGTMHYESAAFHDLCDELGLLVWQDLMFANFDYPFAEPGFKALVDREVDAVIETIGGRPSIFCICGGSEVEQQAAMFGVEPGAARAPFFATELPAKLADAGIDALYVPSAPCGADRPLLPGQGVSNWFGVGGYRRPLDDVRRAGVRFASECLALANIGDDAPDPNAPEWKRGVPRDSGADWDFDDVRDHYLELLYKVDAADLKASEPGRWLQLSKQVSGEVMSEVLGEWRRAQSGCGGAFILWLRDLVPGAGWGLIDSVGTPKPVLRAIAPVLAAQAIWMTDEGMGGYSVHVANDRPEPLDAIVAIELTRSGKRIDGGEQSLHLAAHSQWSGDVETIIGRWVDVGYTYRFGPPAHDLVTAELRTAAGERLGQAKRYPLGRGMAA